MPKQPKDRQDSFQLQIDRKLAMQFRGLCMMKGTTASLVVGKWIADALEAGDVPAVPKPRPAKPKGK